MLLIYWIVYNNLLSTKYKGLNGFHKFMKVFIVKYLIYKLNIYRIDNYYQAFAIGRGRNFIISLDKNDTIN
jgi:hypothetical protein